MKTYRIVVMITLFIGIWNSHIVKAQESEQRDQYTVEVKGLGCPFCAYGLEKKFKEFKAIDDIAITMETGIFKFTYPSSTPLSIATVMTQVEKAGYSPEHISIIRFDGSKEEQPLIKP